MSMLPIQALSIRMCATMFPPSSATAIFIGCPISFALFSAALITRRASSSFTADIDSSLQLFQHVVRRAQVGELGEQIAVWPNPISCHLPVREDTEEDIGDVVVEYPAIVREGRGARGVVAQDVRQQCPCHPPCFLRSIPTRMLQRVREDGNETGITRRFPGEVGIILLAGKEGSLVRPRAAIRLDPAPARAVCRNERAGP